VARIVDEPDATSFERQIDEVATNATASSTVSSLRRCGRLSPYNSLGEYYLTDTVAVLHDAGYASRRSWAGPVEALEVNDRAQLAAAEGRVEGAYQQTVVRRGVTMWIRGGPTWTRPSPCCGRHSAPRCDPARHDDRRCRSRAPGPRFTLSTVRSRLARRSATRSPRTR